MTFLFYKILKVSLTRQQNVKADVAPRYEGFVLLKVAQHGAKEEGEAPRKRWQIVIGSNYSECRNC